ncbi:hypothetical protein G9A89_002880 [Geosiphon pyriformis]|nr:hypothetical protein G9A89_002880 [Geosiphon pyriformis]
MSTELDPSQRIIRPLTPLERFYTIRQSLDYYHNILSMVTYNHPLLASIPSSALIETLTPILTETITHLINSLPSLSIAITDIKSDEPKFVHVPEINLNQIIRFVWCQEKQDVEQVFEDEHDLVFDQEDTRKVLWRCVVLLWRSNGEMENFSNSASEIQTSTTDQSSQIGILFCYHHSIGDGQSSFVFHSELSSLLNTNFSNFSIKLQSKSQSPQKTLSKINTNFQQIAPPLEHFINLRPPFLKLIRLITPLFLIPEPIKNVFLPDYWGGDIHAMDVKKGLKTKVIIIKVEEEVLNEIYEKAKQNETTVHAVMNTAMVFGIYKHLLPKKVEDNSKSNVSNKKKMIRTSSPISFRKQSSPPIPVTNMGNYISEVVVDIPFTKIQTKGKKADNLFWNMARDWKKQCLQQVEGTKYKIWFLKLLGKKFGKWEKWVKERKHEKRGMGRDASGQISNLGRWIPRSDEESKKDIDKNSQMREDNWKIMDIIFSQSANVIGGAIQINAATYKDTLSLALTYQEGAIDSSKVELFSNAFLDALREIAQKGNINI